MQVQKFLLTSFKSKMADGPIPDTLEFLTDEMPELSPYEGEILDLDKLIELFSTRANYCVQSAAMKLMADPSKSLELFNDMQPFEFIEMTRAYYDIFVIKGFIKFLSRLVSESTKKVFTNMLLLHMLFVITQQTVYFSRVLSASQLQAIPNLILDLCSTLRQELLQLTFLFPQPNFSLGALGNEDLQVYKRLKEIRDSFK